MAATLSVTIFDEDHSEDEECWVALGRAENGAVLVMIHTIEEVSANELYVRIISARRADRDEARDYERVPR